MTPIARFFTSLSLLALTGCASNGDPRDPLEPMNRAVYNFNEKVDQYALKPVAEGYKKVTPSPVQTGVRNFFSNLDDVTVLLNNLLQLKLENATSDLMRVAINTGFGFGGLLDIASEMGLRKHNEDFGQTLGKWGVGSGPYLVLPLLGPSTVRDAGGKVVDWTYADPGMQIQPADAQAGAVTLNVVHKRADLLGAKSALEAAALDPYEFLRDFYLERRLNQVYDGKPPEELLE